MTLGAFIEAIKRAQTARYHWTRAASHLADRVKAIRGDFAGNVTIEFGFIVLFMVTLAIGAFDFGRLGHITSALSPLPVPDES